MNNKPPFSQTIPLKGELAQNDKNEGTWLFIKELGWAQLDGQDFIFCFLMELIWAVEREFQGFGVGFGLLYCPKKKKKLN